MHYGSEEMKQKYLPRMVSGEVITAIAMTEPGAGSDLQGMRTTAIKDGDDYIINGSKTFITNGNMADMVIVCAKTDPSKGAKGISLFAVDTDTPGFKKGRILKKLGLKVCYHSTCKCFIFTIFITITRLKIPPSYSSKICGFLSQL